ncbi:MAG: GWxTD domain-containing protein [Bacteroidia bacterium]
MKKVSLYLILLVVVSCGSSRDVKNNKTTLNTYKDQVNRIHPEFLIFHLNDTISELNFKINSNELLYTRPDGINFLSNTIISYLLLPSYDSKEVIDSASVRLVDENNVNSDRLLFGKIKIKAKEMRNYYLRITVADLNRGTNVTQVLFVEKDNVLNKQNFIAQSTSTNIPLFNNIIKKLESIKIIYKEKRSAPLFVRYYSREFPMAAPAFSITEATPFQYKPDSIFTIQLDTNGVLNFTATKTGFYHFQLDTAKRYGLTLYNFSEEFPEIKKIEDMIAPLRYITSNDEYNELLTSTNKKEAFEKFWLTHIGSRERVKESIRKYYNRVQDANIYYSSYIEGWKTDRGMIYLLFGTPNVIYRTASTEAWLYGEENSINTLRFLFTKVNNPFTDNDYSLERSQSYKQPWYIAVDAWRQGKTYLQN